MRAHGGGKKPFFAIVLQILQIQVNFYRYRFAAHTPVRLESIEKTRGYHLRVISSVARWVVLAPLLAGLAACGGGSSSGSADSIPSSSSSPSGTSYKFVMPPVGAQRSYDQTVVDSANNTIIGITIQDTVTADNPDGSYVSTEAGTPTSVVNGTNYGVAPATITDSSSGQVLTDAFTPSGGTLITCTDNPHGGGPDYPVSIGQTWSMTDTETCSDGASNVFTQTGSVMDLESVTVPAGTFFALKLQSTISWTTAGGTTWTETETNWRDASTGYSVKNVITKTYTGTAPTNGYAASVTTVLLSQSP